MDTALTECSTFSLVELCFWVFQAPGRSSEDQEVVLFRTDPAGRAWPVNAPSGPREPHGGRRKKKAVRNQQRLTMMSSVLNQGITTKSHLVTSLDKDSDSAPAIERRRC